MPRAPSGLLAALPLLALLPALAQAVEIEFVATDLADEVEGEDLWEVAYWVSDFPHDAGHGFSVLFDPVLYEQLASPPPAVNADWDVISIQPDVLLPADGLYDAQALADLPSVADPFVVSFVWLGEGEPGDQPFEVYDDSFFAIESGTTVPEPAPAHAAAAALAACAALARRRRGASR